METDNPEGETLRSHFLKAITLKDELDRLVPSHSNYDSKLALSRKQLIDAKDQVDARGVFSPNEALDDVATSDLTFLQIDFLLADLSTKAATGDGPPDPAARIQSLHHAQTYYNAFLTRVDQYDLLSRGDERLLERWKEGSDKFEVLGSPDMDATARRGHKIARYQARKQLQQNVKRLEPGTSLEAKSDEETYRDAELARLALAIHDSFDALDLIAAEQRLLKLAVSSSPPGQLYQGRDAREDNGRETNTYSERLDQPFSTRNGGRGGPLLSPKGRPMQPFVLTGDRQQIKNGVFRSGHRLPTMSIDEYLEAEKARGGIIEGGGQQSGQATQLDEDNEAAADRETEKQRAWDDFKENNPKGSGNTLNRG